MFFCRIVGQTLVVQIHDNGKGISPEKLKELFNISDKHTSSIALKNIADRIRYHYGTDYGVTIHSELNKGTNVVINMPYIPEQHERG